MSRHSELLTGGDRELEIRRGLQLQDHDPEGLTRLWRADIEFLLGELQRVRLALQLLEEAVPNFILAEAGSAATPTGDQLVDRLRGIYTIPVNAGHGELDGKTEFTRTFFASPINRRAADRIEQLKQQLVGSFEHGLTVE